MTSTQTTLDRQLADVKHDPVMTLDEARGWLRFTSRYVLDRIHDHDLAWAWDIGNGSRNNLVRILRVCVESYFDAKRVTLAEPQVLALLLPPNHRKPYLTNGEIQRALNCERDLVLDLIKAGELQQQPGNIIKRGQHGSALVTVESFQQFMTARRMK